MRRSSSWEILPWVILSFVWILIGLNRPFFWDTIHLASRQATWFYENGFSSWVLPNEIDSGHIPFFGAYIAALWKIFGRTLSVGHLAMLPFIWGTVWFLFKIVRHYTNGIQTHLILALVFIDATILSQWSLVSPDVALLCFFSLCWYANLYKKKGLFAFGLILMTAVSMRGMMLAAAFFIWTLYQSWNSKERSLKQLARNNVIPFLPAGILAAGFLLFHQLEKGWIGYHPDSPWSEAFEAVSIPEMGRNIVVIGWRFVDYGRIGLWLITGMIFILPVFRQSLKKEHKQMLLFFLIIGAFLSFSGIVYHNISMHRYLMPAMVIFSVLSGIILWQSCLAEGWKIILYTSSIILLISGHFWIYSDTLDQGWDATTAHHRIFPLFEETLSELDKRGIDFEDVGTTFPLKSNLDFMYLNGDQRQLLSKEVEQVSYLLQSNVCNDFDDDELKNIQQNNKVVFTRNNLGVYITLYKK